MDFLLGKFGMWIIFIGMPVVQFYHLICENVFLNLSAKEAQGIERLASFVLAPTHYILGGKEVQKLDDGFKYTQRFDYSDHFLVKATVSTITLPLSISFGAALKAIAYLTPDTRNRHSAIVNERESLTVRPNTDYYQKIGLKIQDLETASFIPEPSHQRRPGEEHVMQKQKEALKEIVAILKENKIPFLGGLWYLSRCATIRRHYPLGLGSGHSSFAT